MHDLQDIISAPPLALIIQWRPAPGGDPAELYLTRAELALCTDCQAEITGTLPYREHFQERLERQVRGEDPDWKGLPSAIDLDMTGLTPFAREVLDTLWDAVPFGKTVSYGDLAALAGRPRAARAVGRIMSGNRWSLIIPAHRVVASGGKLGGYGGEDGVTLKQWLLEREGWRASGGRRK